MKTNQIVYAALAIVLLAGLFFMFKKQVNNTQTQTVVSREQPSSPSPSPETNIKTFELVVEQKKLVSGSETIKVNEGDEVTIKVTSDEAEELHIHGYDNSVDLEPGKQAEIVFTASLTGRFIFELEKSGTDLGAIEVSPK